MPAARNRGRHRQKVGRERRVRLPFADPRGRSIGCVCLTNMIYNSPATAPNNIQVFIRSNNHTAAGPNTKAGDHATPAGQIDAHSAYIGCATN